MPAPLHRSLVLGAALAAAAVPPPAAANVDLPRHPSVSPDGSSVVFSWRGDLWKAPSTGGAALRLTSHPQDDLQSAWSPDGTRIAFTSTRNGHRNVWVMQADGTGIRPLTDVDRPCTLGGWGVDAAGAPVVTFSSALEGDVYRDARPYMVPADGGPVRRVHDAFGSVPVIAADGRRVAFTRGGYYEGWERRHYRGPEAADVWVYDGTDGSFARLTTWNGNDGKARWGGPRTLLYLSDRADRTVNLYRMSATDGEAASVRLTRFEGRDVQDFDVSADGRTAVLAVWDTLYRLDLDDPRAQPEPIALIASEDARDDERLLSIDDTITEAALAPDGKTLAVVAYGEVYVRSVEEAAVARRVTEGPAREEGVAWSPDGLTLYFSSDRDGTESIYAATVARTRGEVRDAFTAATGIPAEVLPADPDEKPASNEDAEDDDEEDGDGEDVAADGDAKDDAEDGAADDPARDPSRWHDAIAFTIAPVVQRATNDREPSPSPDGRHLAFRSTRGRIELLGLESGAIRTLVDGWDMWTHWTWSPDGRHLAYAQSDLDFNSDIFVVDVDGGGPPVNVTRHPDNDVEPRFSADGRILAFLSERVDEQMDAWMVMLDRDLESLTPQELTTYFDRATRAANARKPLPVPSAKDAGTDDGDTEDAGAEDAAAPTLELDDAWLRLRRVTTLVGDEASLALAPGGDRLYFTTGDPAPGLHAIKWDGTDLKRLGDAAAVQHVDLGGTKLVVVSAKRAATVETESGKLERLDVNDRIVLDLAAQSSQKFREAARRLGEGYYDPDLNGLDWEAVSADYHDLARRARTADEFNWVANRFLGELNGSHLGVYANDPAAPLTRAYGRLGIDARPVDRGFEVTRVLPRSPAATGPMALRPGDVIVAVDGAALGDDLLLRGAFKDRVGRETVVSIERPGPDGPVAFDALLAPIGWNEERQLRYDAWRADNARLVDEWSDGRLGYIHIQGMNQPSLEVFERDLYAAAHGRDGLVIDVRNNGGGWTTDRVLASIMVREHAYTIPRGADPDATGHYPQDRLFIQRYDLPINLLCNEKSFSNAEIFSHAFRTLDRGTLVGRQTFGGVISTGGWELIDGTWVRLPFRGWFLPDGTNMELNGAMPDLDVQQTPEDEVRGADAQLRSAVEDLLGRLP